MIASQDVAITRTDSRRINGLVTISWGIYMVISVRSRPSRAKIRKILTVSIGGATTLPARNHHPDDFARHVDKMLYQAKRTRNSAVWSFFLENDQKR